MASRVLIPAGQTAVSVKKKFGISSNEKLPVLIFATGLAGSEKVELFISPDSGDNWQKYSQKGEVVELLADNTGELLLARGTYAVTKSSSNSDVAVYINDAQNF